MPDNPVAGEVWLRVIARSLAYLCLKDAQKAKPDDFVNLLDRVKFLEDLGLPETDAAYAAGSNLESVRVQKSKRRGGKGGRKK